MLELKITITAPDLADAINNLATALGKRETADAERIAPAKPKKTANPTPAPVPQPNVAPAITPTTADAAPVNPTMAAPGAPSSATIAPAAVPVANVVPQIPIPPAPVQYAAPVPPVTDPVPAPVPTSAPQYTLEMIATAGSALIDAGKLDQLMELLGKYGVVTLTDLDPSQYGALALDLRALGAHI